MRDGRLDDAVPDIPADAGDDFEGGFVMEPQWTKKELEDWCLGFCRTPHTTLKAFIDAGFCTDQEPSREELRLWPKPDTSPIDETEPSTPCLLSKAIARLNRAAWDIRAIPSREDIRILLDAFRRLSSPEPPKGQRVWYRGWECYFNHTAAQWTGTGWVACLGGEDLDCISVDALTWDGLLDEIDDHDMTKDVEQ